MALHGKVWGLCREPVPEGSAGQLDRVRQPCESRRGQTPKTGLKSRAHMCSTPSSVERKRSLASEFTWKDLGGNGGGQGGERCGAGGKDTLSQTPAVPSQFCTRHIKHRLSMNTREQTHPWCHLHKAMECPQAPL